jgi:hypothetical protein
MIFQIVTGYAVQDGEDDMDGLMQQAEANSGKFPPAIAALVQPGVTVTGHSYGSDPINRTFVMLEFFGNKPVKAYAGGISPETTYHFKLTAYDSNNDMSKFLIQGVQNSQPEVYKNARQSMKEISFSSSDPSPVIETKTGYGIALSRKFHFPSMPDGCGFSLDQTYYSCHYVGRVKDIFFEYQVDAIAIDKSQVEQWFQNMIAKMQGISVSQLL